MVENLLVMINSLREIADEMGTVGIHESAFPEAVRQYNEVLSRLRDWDADNAAWSIISPLNSNVHSPSDLAVACAMVKKIVKKAEEVKRGPHNWFVRNRKHPLEIHSSYEGDIIVEPGCRLELHGSVRGRVILMGNAELACHGAVEGIVETDIDSIVELHGRINGSVVPRTSNVSIGDEVIQTETNE